MQFKDWLEIEIALEAGKTLMIDTGRNGTEFFNQQELWCGKGCCYHKFDTPDQLYIWVRENLVLENYSSVKVAE